MEITEIRIKLMDEPGERLRAFCSITLDDSFVIRDLKIIEGTNGPFVAMPSRKLTARCPDCGYKNHVRAGYCNQCGMRLRPASTARDEDGRPKLYADIAHPINSDCREMIQESLIQAYQEEAERAQQPGYVPHYYDDEDTSEQVHREQVHRQEIPRNEQHPARSLNDHVPRPHIRRPVMAHSPVLEDAHFSESDSRPESGHLSENGNSRARTESVNPAAAGPAGLAAGEVSTRGRIVRVDNAHAHRPAERRHHPPLESPADTTDPADSFGAGIFDD